MVSGFLTSPWLHCRMWSAVARPMRSSSKTLTSSKVPTFLAERVLRVLVQCPAAPDLWAPRGDGSDFFDAARLEAAGQVDAQLFGRAVDVVVRVAHLDGHTVAGQ